MEESNEFKMSLSPAALTSRACIMGAASNGDKDARLLLDFMRRSEIPEENREIVEDSDREELYRFTSAYGTFVWVGNTITDRMFNNLRMSSFVDLGCGLTKRGIALARYKGVRYYGYDLPQVIEKLENALKMSGMWNLGKYQCEYIPADVTNYDVLRSSLKNDDPLFIATEVLMMYLTESEMITVVDNIAKLLSEFGGVWVTCDPDQYDIFRQMLGGFLGGGNAHLMVILNSLFSEKWQKLIFDNSFMKLKGDDFTAFLEEHGLYCNKKKITTFLQSINAPANIKKAYENAYYYMISSKSEFDKLNSKSTVSEFSLESSETDDMVTIYVKGRLDAVTSPQLVDKYENYVKEKGLCKLLLDMSECVYMSSAGLRAMIILFKRTKSIENGFFMRNIRPEIFEIFELTSFSELIKQS